MFTKTPTNSETEQSLLKALNAEGFELLIKNRLHGKTGVDILAKNKNKEFHIEVIGFKRSPPARSKDFFESFFRVISRLNDGAKHCIVALPKRFGDGLHQRARQYRIGWKRIGDVFPELEIWLVDTELDTYKKTTWNSWLSV